MTLQLKGKRCCVVATLSPKVDAKFAAAGVPILGTSLETIDLAEDRDRFRHVMRRLGIPQPESGMASTLDEALQIAGQMGYPLMVRPSCVLGGRAMEVVHDEAMLRQYVAAAVGVSPELPILVDKFLENGTEVPSTQERRNRIPSGDAPRCASQEPGLGAGGQPR